MAKKMRSLGIDPSISATGLVLLEDSGTPTPKLVRRQNLSDILS